MSIDGTRHLTELERILQSGNDFGKCHEAFAVLKRWSNDEMLSLQTRLYAQDLLERYCR